MGCVLFCAGGFKGAWSAKQTKSSTESELVGLADECGWAIQFGPGTRRAARVYHKHSVGLEDFILEYIVPQGCSVMSLRSTSLSLWAGLASRKTHGFFFHGFWDLEYR